MFLRRNTAVDVLIGPFVDSTDAYTPETGLSPAVKLSKAGQALAAKSDATPPVHDADGYYNCELDATDTNSIGELKLTVAGDATSLGVLDRFQVVEEAVYDAMYGAGAAGPLQSTVAGRTLDITTTGAAGIDWANVENPTTAVDLSETDIQLCDTITTYTGNTKQTGDNYAQIGIAGAGLTDLGGMSSGMSADIYLSQTVALSDYDGPTNAEMVAAFTEVKGATWASGTDTLEAIRNRGDAAWTTGSAPTAAQIVDEWETQSQADPTGFHVNVLEVGGTAQTPNDNGADINAILADTNELQGDDVPTLIAALNDLAAADVNAEVVDVLKTDTIADRSAGLPPATPTFEQAIAYLYGSMRNSIDVDSGFKEFYNNAGALIWKKALSDDGSNYVEAKSVAP